MRETESKVFRSHSRWNRTWSSDIRMPRLDGIGAALQIRAELPAARLVMLSAYDEQALRTEAREAGASAFLIKGCPLGEIVRAVAS